jgi:dUTP pyrophosphatase
MDIIEQMREKILLISDPNSGYTQEDFDREFGESQEMIMDEFYKLRLTFSNKSKNEDPQYATEGSSGFDLRADLSESLVIKVGKRAIVPTGLFFELPENFEMQIRPRSGLAAKNGVTVLNTPGTIDNDYRGEIKVILINLGEEDFTVNNGDRIAQGVMAPVYGKDVINFVKVSEVSTDTTRSDGGFGSTGLN